MKVLLLHQHFNTPQQGGAIRTYYLAKALVDSGINPVVITGSNEPRYRVENVEGIEVHYLPVAYHNAFGFLSRSIAFLKYIAKSVRLAGKLRGIDLCYAVSAPLTVGLAAMRIKKRTGIPFIFEVGDLWPDAPVQMGIIKNRIFVASLFRLEKRIYHSASAIVALSEPIRAAISDKVPGKRIHVIPNMADCAYYVPEQKKPDVEKKFGVQKKFVVSYIGTAGMANGLNYFLSCAALAQKIDLPMYFILCGDGAALPGLRATALAQGLKNIFFAGHVNRDGVKEVMNITDAVLVSFKNIPILQTGSPNKYFDGLAAGKMIITNVPGWIGTEVETTGCGIFVDPEAPSDFVQKMKSLAGDLDEKQAFQRKARNLAESKYDRKKLAVEFAQLLRSEIANRS